MAATPPVSNNENAGFLRSDAGFAGLCFGDVPDCSSDFRSSATIVEPLMKSYHKLASIKGINKLDQMVFSGAGPITAQGIADCHNLYLNQALWERYERIPEMAELTGGAATEICQQNWYAELAESLGAAAGYRTEFPLSGTPDAATLPVVLVDGVPVSAADAQGNVVWSYDVNTRKVKFADGHVPGPGSEVRIQYSQTCY